MILKNKLTKEILDIPYSEFRKMFAKEIQDAFESYRRTQLNKYSWNFKMIILWSLIFILNSIGTLITLGILIGILNACNYLYISFNVSISILILLSFNIFLRLLNNAEIIFFLQSFVPW